MWRKRTNTRDFFAGFATQQVALVAAQERINELNSSRESTATREKVCGPLKKRKARQGRD